MRLVIHRAVIAAALLLTVIASGCAPRATGSAATAYKLPDGELTDRYIEGLDVALGDKLVFTDSKQIPSDTLYMFFSFVASRDDATSQSWYNRADDRFHIPLAAVTTTLNRYFDAVSFDPTKITTYVPATKEFVTPIFGGFGGARFVKLQKRAVVSADTIRLTADFYDGPNYAKIVSTKVYTIRVLADGYHYVSITKGD